MTSNLSVALSPLATRLVHHYKISQGDLIKLEDLKFRQLEYKAGDELMDRGTEMKDLMVLVSGWAIRCRYTPDGDRQIIHILLPGDVITPSVFVTRRTDHSVSALSDVVIRMINPRDMQELFAETRTLAAAFWWTAEQEHGVLREQIVRLGRRSALERVPHLFLELHRRLILVGQATEQTFILPLTQTDIADTLGLSNVHINRTLKKLVAGNYIQYSGPVIQIPDSRRLTELCDFDMTHLHLDSDLETAISTGTV